MFLKKEKIKKNKYLLILCCFSLAFLVIFIIVLIQPPVQPPVQLPIQPPVQPPVQPPTQPPVQPPVQGIEQDFETTGIGINTLDNLIDKLNTEFTYQQREAREIRFPQEFFELKQGNQLDFALFSAYVLRRNNLGEAAVIRYKYLNEQEQQRINTVVAFRGPGLPPKHIAFGPEGAQVFTYGWSFGELFQMEEQRLGITITEYEIFLLWPLPTSDDLWPEQWRQR